MSVAKEALERPFWEPEPVPTELPVKAPIEGIEDVSDTVCLVVPKARQAVLAIVDGIVYYNCMPHRKDETHPHRTGR